jgi:hypothetical protein
MDTSSLSANADNGTSLRRLVFDELDVCRPCRSDVDRRRLCVSCRVARILGAGPLLCGPCRTEIEVLTFRVLIMMDFKKKGI